MYYRKTNEAEGNVCTILQKSSFKTQSTLKYMSCVKKDEF
uniref:Uncharacterized protein n=1 Tax=Anguilla anguilla TaxID=7936 RepID=A0A0E9QVG4_ANGAN